MEAMPLHQNESDGRGIPPSEGEAPTEPAEQGDWNRMEFQGCRCWGWGFRGCLGGINSYTSSKIGPESKELGPRPGDKQTWDSRLPSMLW